jgi:hypothetical protein
MDVLDALESLVEKSLLRQEDQADGTPRFVMLQTVREYALERLHEGTEAEAVYRRHAAFCVTLAEQAEQGLRGREQVEWYDRLEREHDNFRQAVRWLVEHGEAEHGLRLASALAWFWVMRGHLAEGRGWLSRVLALPEVDGYPALLTRALASSLAILGGLALDQGMDETARALLGESLALRQAIEDGDAADQQAAEGRAAAFLERLAGPPAGRAASLQQSIASALAQL